MHRVRPFAIALMLVLGLAACTDDDDPTASVTIESTTTSTTARTSSTATQTSQQALTRPYIQGSTVTDVSAWVDDLLTVAVDNADPSNTKSDSMGIVDAWVAAFPFLKSNVKGYRVEATANGISGFTIFPVNDKDVPSPSNPVFLAFAAKDASGKCAGGVVSGHPAPTTPKKLPITGPCTGTEARKASGF